MSCFPYYTIPCLLPPVAEFVMMSRTLDWVLYGASFLVFINAVLVIYKPISSHDSPNPREKHSDKNPQQCSCSCNDSLDSHELLHGTLHSPVDYSSVAMATPQLDPSYLSETLTRLGSDLNFDVNSSCPLGSIMADKHRANATPLHYDCPTLFIVGARKAGTTSLYHYLSKHPDFEGTRLERGPKSGETFYFSSEYQQKSWNRYLSYFPPDGVMTGEASVGYLVKCDVPRRIFESCGKQAKIVVLLRNPIDRFVSNFLMRVRVGGTRIQNTTALTTVVKTQLDALFAKAFSQKADVTKLQRDWKKLVCLFDPANNLVFEGLYYVHLLNWLCNFPGENILILNSEEFYRNTSTILKQVFQYLGLKELDDATHEWITSNVYNRGGKRVPSYQKLSAVDRKKLQGVFEPLNMALFKLLRWSTVTWS